jgi:hypothetical protein
VWAGARPLGEAGHLRSCPRLGRDQAARDRCGTEGGTARAAPGVAAQSAPWRDRSHVLGRRVASMVALAGTVPGVPSAGAAQLPVVMTDPAACDMSITMSPPNDR